MKLEIGAEGLSIWVVEGDRRLILADLRLMDGEFALNRHVIDKYSAESMHFALNEFGRIATVNERIP